MTRRMVRCVPLLGVWGRETGEARAWWRKAWGEWWFAAPLRRKGYGLCVLLCTLVSRLTSFRAVQHKANLRRV